MATSAPPSLNKLKYVPTHGTYPLGFSVSAVHVGIKPGNVQSNDLCLLASTPPAAAAAVFTQNKFQAPPVLVSRELLRRNNGERIHAVLVNSGCANAVTGKRGIEDAWRMSEETNRCLKTCHFNNDAAIKDPASTIVMSTGVIGQVLPIQKIINKIPEACKSLSSTHEAWLSGARAICTTDTFPKLLSREFTLPSSKTKYRISGMAKGAGMIHPDMATLLAIMCTDAPIPSPVLHQLLHSAVAKSFNSISIDGDTSTNDTVALLANGAAGNTSNEGHMLSENSFEQSDFKDLDFIVSSFASDLSKLVVRDGEGATKFVTVRVVDSMDYNSAHAVAKTVATSSLVKTAIYGQDANWGRILCATGYASGVTAGAIVPESTSVSLVVPGKGMRIDEEMKLLVNGEPQVINEERASGFLTQEDIEIMIKLGTGHEKAEFHTCDFSHEYITINANYRT